MVIYTQATLAQLVEQSPCKGWVVGSNPSGGSNYEQKSTKPFTYTTFRAN